MRLAGVVSAIGALVIAPRVVYIPEESLPKLKSSLGDELVALPDGLRPILLHHGKRVVVFRTTTHCPRTIRISDGVGGRIVVHGIEHGCTLIACGNTIMLAIHGVEAHRQSEVVFQYLGRNERTNIEAVHTRHLNHTLALNQVTANHVIGCGITAADVHVMAVADTSTEHLILPVNIGTTIFQRNARIALCVIAQIAGRSHVVSLQDMVEGNITIVHHVRLFLGSLLGGDHNHAIGSLRTIDGRGGSITEHVNALDVVW